MAVLGPLTPSRRSPFYACPYISPLRVRITTSQGFHRELEHNISNNRAFTQWERRMLTHAPQVVNKEEVARFYGLAF